MANPLALRRGEGGGSSGGSGPMEPGDVRTINVKDKDGTITKTLTLHRTDRDYAYDLCDAYNAARTRDDIEWFVDANKTVRLGTPHKAVMNRLGYSEANAETARNRWKAAQQREGV